MAKKPFRIAVLTSGGDAPGMNACLRALVRMASHHGVEVLGVRRGFEGLIDGDWRRLSPRSVGNTIQRGGTILGSARSDRFLQKKFRARAFEQLKEFDVGCLITLGGDGTLTGAKKFSEEFPIRVIGIPCTIDNDLSGTDFAIGFDTAVNTAVQCIDKIRDTADSHGRVFVIEVMGKNTGHLALEVGLAAGAEFAVIPEIKFSMSSVALKIKRGIERGKTGSIVILAEREKPGFSFELAKGISRHIQRDVRTTLLGHLQRGGSPSVKDRNLGSRFGAYAVELAMKGKNRVMVGEINQQLTTSPFSKVIGVRRPADLKKLKLIDILSE